MFGNVEKVQKVGMKTKTSQAYIDVVNIMVNVLQGAVISEEFGTNIATYSEL